jgi:hypothetical protein
MHGHTWKGEDGKVKRSPTYMSWQNMIARCTYASTPSYFRYGGRGIRVCKRWRSFLNFLVDMGERPEGMTLDRRDSDWHYTPRNCRWATYKEQTADQQRSKITGRYV